jgi:hypothetical protein
MEFSKSIMNCTFKSTVNIASRLVAFLLCLSYFEAAAQKQLVLLKRQKVLLRLEYGDDLSFKMKGSDDIVRSYVNNIYDTAVVAHKTVVPFHKIERLYFNNYSQNLLQKIGGGLVVGGIGYFAIDQLNEIVIQGEDASLNRKVTITSIAMVATGLPLMLIKKKSQRMKPGFRLLAVDRGSPFYQNELGKP